MKRLFTLILIIGIGGFSASAQDTLAYENFDVDPTSMQSAFPSGTTNDVMWTNFDEDALMAANGRPGNWYWTAGYATMDTMNRVFSSSSWLDGFAPGNRNWLMTPAMPLADNTGMLSWTSAPFQFPLYADGYTVLVSTTDNNEASFTDTLYQSGSYLSGSGGNVAAYTFTPGDLHGGGNPPGPYFEFDSDSSRWLCLLEPHSVSLAMYAGQTIYVAFLHDSDDDNLMSIDDILVTGTSGAVGINENEIDLSLSTFPNPASESVQLSYYLPKTSAVNIYLYNINGEKVKEILRGTHMAGEHNFVLNVNDLASGQYLVSIESRNGTVTKNIIVE
ncbi:MAG: T9SS type A sorting domain-containing protein [Bacteroidia bacterium]|nr:T9SS type A sorting domain-containing protein [Bacteroidia bacterium]